MSTDVRRLGPGDRDLARDTLVLLANVFGEAHEPLGDAYLDRLLARPDLWVICAQVGDDIAGGLTAHELMMTTSERSELFLYDIAVAEAHRRLGIGRSLVQALRDEGRSRGIDVVFVPADGDDDEAREFYRALGGTESAVAMFEFE